MDFLDVNGELIRRLREQMNWTRAKLSEESGVPERTIQDIETGVSKNPGLYTIHDILKKLPNYPDDRKNELVLRIHNRLSTLNYDQLRTVFQVIDDLGAMPDTLDSRTTRTE